MKPSIINSNYPHCPYCDNVNRLKIVESDIAKIDEEIYFELKARCWNCSNQSYYFLDLNMRKRISIDKSDERYSKFTEEKKQELSDD